MSLTAGTQLGPYEVVDLLGSGAMGEVYRARDVRLRRHVALKVLPASVTDDPARLQRFQQEARAAGALNHPNIVAIHDIGEAAGSPYVVSELLEGEPLRERMAGQPLAPRKVLELGVQIARGLAAAHERGIVHRDLKPDNVFVTRDGSVKILDFGLAKLQRVGVSLLADPGSTESPTASITEPGTVLGTVGYMSPEQVRGQAADHRSDIFSLGAILYEMLTGRRAFRGRSAVETMHAILKEEPPQITDVNRDLPPALERMVTHCLEKNPDERFQSARDLAFDLEALSHLSTTSARAVWRFAESPWRRARPALAAAAILALPLLGYLVGHFTAEAPVPTYQRLTYRRGLVGSARFAPDGHVVYTAAWDGQSPELFTARAEAPESRTLGLRNAAIFAISKNGDMTVLLHDRGPRKPAMLARASEAGGPPREILEGVSQADAVADGSKIAIVRLVDGRARLEYPVGTMLYESRNGISHPRISPDGQRVAFLEHPLFEDDRGWVSVIDASGQKKQLSPEMASAQGLAWRPDGKEVWFTGAEVGADSALYAVDLSGRHRLVTRAPGRLVLHDISADGRVLMNRVAARMEMRSRTTASDEEQDLSWFDYSAPRDLSSDGKQLLFYESGEGGGRGYGIYLRGTEGSLPVRLGEGIAQSLSRDGRWALSIPLDEPSRLVLLPTGAGEPRVVRDETIEKYQVAWLFPDAERILTVAVPRGGNARLFVQDVKGGPARPVLRDGVVVSGNRPISPDGRYVTAYPPEAKLAMLYPLDGGDPLPIKGMQENEAPMRWSGDGKWMYVRRGSLPVEVTRLNLATGEREAWQTVAPADRAGVPGLRSILPTPDGSGYVYTYMRHLSELYVVDGLI
jgi:Tol biopolymer transport system component